MNASISFRNSYIFNPNAPNFEGNYNGRRHTAWFANDEEQLPGRRRNVPAGSGTISSEFKPNTITHHVTLHSGESAEVLALPEPEISGPATRIWRMVTVYPVRDMNWLVAMVFVLGTLSFLANSLFTLLPITTPELTFEGEATIAAPATITIGGLCFFSGGFMALLAAFNIDRGGENGIEGKLGKEDLENPKAPVYSPALLGSDAWVWWPSSFELKTYFLPNIAFRAGLIQLFGGFVFSVPLVAGFPGVLGEQQAFLIPPLVFFPQVLGGILLLAANMITMIMAQEKWYCPSPSNINWNISFLTSLGSLGFVFSGSFLLLAPQLALELTVISFAGNIAFFIGTILQWYALMAYY